MKIRTTYSGEVLSSSCVVVDTNSKKRSYVAYFLVYCPFGREKPLYERLRTC